MIFCSHKDSLQYYSFRYPAFQQLQRSNQSPEFADWQHYELYLAVLQALGQWCSTPEVHSCVRLCWGMLRCIFYQGIQTPRSWKLGFTASCLSFQLQIIGLLENRVQESAHKSLLFHMLIGNEIGTASTSFLYRMKSNAADLSSFACLADGRASATLIAAIQDSERDNTLKRWPRMKRLDESRRTLTWTD